MIHVDVAKNMHFYLCKRSIFTQQLHCFHWKSPETIPLWSQGTLFVPGYVATFGSFLFTGAKTCGVFDLSNSILIVVAQMFFEASTGFFPFGKSM